MLEYGFRWAWNASLFLWPTPFKHESKEIAAFWGLRGLKSIRKVFENVFPLASYLKYRKNKCFSVKDKHEEQTNIKIDPKCLIKRYFRKYRHNQLMFLHTWSILSTFRKVTSETKSWTRLCWLTMLALVKISTKSLLSHYKKRKGVQCQFVSIKYCDL